MRTYTSGGITVTYPEKFVLSGNNNIVSITGATENTTFSLFGDEREFLSGSGEFDLMPYLQNLFATVGKNEKFSIKTIDEDLLIDGDALVTIDLTQVYFGANEFADKRVLVQQAEYTSLSPWFDFWLPTDAPAKINGVDYDFVEGFNSIDLSDYTGDVLIEFNADGFNTFDDTFDFTFTGEIISIKIQRVECPENGFLVRWIDHWGIWQQKVLDKAATLRNSSKDIYGWNSQPSSALFSGLRFAEVKKSIGVDLVAESCTKTEALRLSELCSSSFVHAYDFNNSEWIPVVVSTNEAKVGESKGRQNMNFNMSIQNDY